MEAVKTKQVFIADFEVFTQPAASSLVNGIEMLTSLFHPDLFETPAHLKNKYVNLFSNQQMYAQA